jgi:hypothetical protein
MVERLVMLVEGTKKNNGANKNAHQIATRKGHMKARKPIGLKAARKIKTIDYQKVSPEKIIPFEDGDFEDF